MLRQRHRLNPFLQRWRGAEWRRVSASLPLFEFLSAILLCLLFFHPVLLQPGWPHNHEALRSFERTAIYAAHFRAGDLFPVWSESVMLGYGGPFPVYYHRLFYYGSGLLHVLGFPLKASVVGALAAFVLLGAWGMQRLLQRLWPSPSLAAWWAGSAFLFSNYAYTLWIVRGALAEFSAMMLLPWVFLWCVDAVKGTKPLSSWLLGAWVFPALYYAHSVIFFYAAAPVVVAVVVGMLRRQAGRFPLAVMALGAWFALLVGPNLLLQRLLGEGFGFFDGIAAHRPESHFRDFLSYVWDRHFDWGNDWRTYSVELNQLFVLGSILAVGMLLWRAVRPCRTGSEQREDLDRISRWLGAGWVLTTVYYVFWLTPLASPFYRHLPLFWLIQFPWRALTFVAVLLVVLPWAALGSWCRRPGRGRAHLLAGVFIGAAYLGSPWMHPIAYEWYEAERIDRRYDASSVNWIGYAEYAPSFGGLDNDARVARLRAFIPRPGQVREWNWERYSARRVDDAGFEGGERRYRLDVREPVTIRLPIAYSPYHQVVFISLPDGVETPKAFRSEEDPRIHLSLPKGAYEVVIRYPTVWRMLAGWLTPPDHASSGEAG